jgi:hypothetical protein
MADTVLMRTSHSNAGTDCFLPSKVAKLHNLVSRVYLASNEDSLYMHKSGGCMKTLERHYGYSNLLNTEIHRQKVGETIRQEVRFRSWLGYGSFPTSALLCISFCTYCNYVFDISVDENYHILFRKRYFFSSSFPILGSLFPLLENSAVSSVSWSETVGRTPWTGDQFVARPLPLHKHRKTHTHTHTLNIHALSGIRTHGPGFRASEDSRKGYTAVYSRNTRVSCREFWS